MKLNKEIRNKNKEYACCDEESKTCDSCSFEESIRINIDSDENDGE